ncbi:MAG: Outer rane lipoprotein omp16 precursor [Labilithrix sp.]|nr:Outer rane lipoprotein omp16 precursor [Labilithrix sp.]
MASGALVLMEGDASAQSVARGFAINRFEPSERGSDWFTNESLDLRGNLRPAFGVIADYQYRPLVTYRADGDVHRSIVRNMLALHAGGSVNLFDRLRLSVSVPLIPFVDGHTDALPDGRVYPSPTHEQALGDVRAAADLRLLGSYGDAFQLAVGAQVWFPTGSEGTYSGDGAFRVQPRVLAAGDVGVFAYAARVGFQYRNRSEDFGPSAIGSELAFGGSVGLRLADRKVTVGPEVFGSTVLDDAFAKRATPLEGILGAHWSPIEELRFGAGVGTGLTRGYGSPEFRALLGVEVMQAIVTDRDGDGIADKDDACPDVKGVTSSDPAKNGCPPEKPADRDGDGIFDKDDACVDEPGVRTSDPRTNGCPPDRDRDGIPDDKDACVDVPGVKTADPKTNGCPPDTDGDGVLDKDDACPAVPGLKTTDPKTNGCPDPDRDKDGIPNDDDACPDEPGDKSQDPKKNGCPKAFVKDDQIRILDQVKFKTGSADIVPGKESEEILEAVSALMKAHPEIQKVRIEGHTDNRGTAALNKKLSADRAGSVVKWLAAHGIDRSRMTSQGFGPDRPIAENTTDEGRQNNRRVEFHIEGLATK